MRLLHTSDWHIGRSLHGTDLLAEQEAVLGGLAEVVARESVDAVLVAGDVYDRAVPSADATAVLDRVLMRVRSAGAAVVLTPGNHDSARRPGPVPKGGGAGRGGGGPPPGHPRPPPPAGLRRRADGALRRAGPRGHAVAGRAGAAGRRARRHRRLRAALSGAGGGPARAA